MENTPSVLIGLRLRMRIAAIDQQKMTQPGCTKLAIVQLLFASASSNLAGR